MKQNPHITKYRSYKKFSNEDFITDFRNSFFNLPLVGKTVLLKNKIKTVEVTFKKYTALEKRYVSELGFSHY